MMKREHVYKGIFLVCVFLMLQSSTSVSYALEGLSLVQAGFTVTDPSEKEPEDEEFVKFVRLKNLGDAPVFFWIKFNCSTKKCNERLKSGDVKLVHRWVRMYGTKLRTRQLKTFLPEELSDENAVWSEQKMTYPGRWFVEVSTSDGETLCIDKICKFKLGVK